MRSVAAYQPRYFPRLHYLARAAQVDVFVLFDHDQFSRRTRQHRTRINDQWLTVPVQRTGTATQINDAKIDLSTGWPASHLETLRSVYGVDAQLFRPSYQDLCPQVLRPAAVRERAETLTDYAKGTLSEFLTADTRWRRQKSRCDRLRHRRNKLADRLAEQATDSRDTLEAAAKRLSDAVNDTEAQLEQLMQERDTRLLTLSREVPTNVVSDAWIGPDSDAYHSFGFDPPVPHLLDLVLPLLDSLFDGFDIGTRVVRSSSLPVRDADPSNYLAQLTDYLDADTYVSGRTGYESYLDCSPFARRGIEVEVQDWTPPRGVDNSATLDVLCKSATPSPELVLP